MTYNTNFDVYISYSKKDQALIEEIGAALSNNQFTHWNSSRGILLPFRQIQAIDTAIENCRVMIVVLTSNYVLDTICHSDIRKGFNKKKPIIVFSAENLEYPESLSSISKWASRENKSATAIPINAWENSIERGIETLLKTIPIFLEQATIENAISKKSLKVFLCHSSSDKPSVEKYYNLLVEDGINAWLDKKSLIPGQDWQFEIQNAVINSDVVIVFLSSKSITKEGFVQKEIRIALDTADEKPDGTIFIIPAKLENCEVPKRLAKFHWVNLFDKDGYELLFKALQTRASSLNVVINRTT